MPCPYEFRLMRLDLFLKASRLSGRRTLAQKLCDAGRVSVNNKVAKSSRAVNLDDEISIRRQKTLTTVRVLAVPIASQTSRQQASSLYEIVSEESLAEGEL